MKRYFSRLLMAVGLAITLFSCTDHRLGGTLSPVQLRLKSVQSGTAVTTYTYDSQNRLATIAGSSGSLGIIAYGDTGKKYVTTDAETPFTYYVSYGNAADPTTGTITRYPLRLDGTSFSAVTYYLINSKISYTTHIRDYQYTFDANKHLNTLYSVDPNSNPSGNSFTYGYTGENITTGTYSYAGGHLRLGTFTYTYDTNINPFYSLLDPTLPDVQRYSRNNPLSAISTDASIPRVFYSYEYNQQGLPTKRTTTSNNAVTEVLIFTYEPY